MDVNGVKKSKFPVFTFFMKVIRIMPFQAIYFLVDAVVNALLPSVQALAVAEIVDCVESAYSGMEEVNKVFGPLAVLLGVVVFKNMMPSVANLVNTAAKNRLNAVVRLQFIKKQTRLAYKYIEDDDACSLIYRVYKDVDAHFWSGYRTICNGIELVIKCAALINIVMRASLLSGIAIFAVSVPLFYISLKVGKQNYCLQKDAVEIKRRYKYLADILVNKEYAKERALFGYAEHIEQEFGQLSDCANQKEAAIQKKRYANMKSGSLTMVLLAVIIVLLLLPALKNGEVSNGLYVGLISAVLNLVQGMSWSLAGVMQGYASIKAYLQEVNIFWNMEEKEGADAEPKRIPDFELDTIEFRHVYFRYPGRVEYVLQDCSFMLRGNRCYAVVGKNGAGKSTLTKLLIGLYDNYEGEILINQRNIRDYRYEELKWMISSVFQDFARYALTLRENIFLGDINKQDLHLLRQIIEDMKMSKYIQELPYGIDSVLGKMEKDSVDLSGGEWQKLAIARLLYSEAPINILDEPTAALDPKSEATVYEMFQKVNGERFTILITHRLGAARMADEILVLDQGRIVEQGTHEDLVAQENGHYQRMFESQRCWYEA